MTQFNKHVLSVILKTPQQRTDEDMSMLMPWLEGKIGILAGISTAVLRDIGKQCEYRRLKNNDVIIRQGDIGDEYFIILSGKASVYIDGNLSGEKEIFHEQSEQMDEVNEALPFSEINEETDIVKRKRSSVVQKSNDPSKPNAESDSRVQRKRSSTVNVENKSSTLSRRESTLSRRSSSSVQPHSRTSFSAGTNRPTRLSTVKRSSTVNKPLTIRQRISLATVVNESSPDLSSTSVEDLCEEKEDTDPRAKFGDYMLTYESGKSFGEMALLSNDAVRNATVLSDGDSGLLVVSKTLFNRAFKADQERELRERKEFIAQCPLFNWWHPKIKQLLQMSLRRETFQFNYPIVDQGSSFRGLFFIIKGAAKVSVSVQQHTKQLPEMSAPKKTQVDEIIIRKEIVAVRRQAQQFSINLRRQQGYAAAEQFNRSRFHDIASVGEGDIIGDFEVVMNLNEYIYSVTATSHVVAFVLDEKNIERFLNKKHGLTMELLTEIVCYKANQRFQTHPELNMILFKNIGEDLLEKIENKDIRETKPHMTEEEREIRRQVVLFLRGRIPMVPHSVPNTLFYMMGSIRDAPMWRRRIREREAIKQDELARKIRRFREPRSAKQMKNLVEEITPTEADNKEKQAKLAAKRNANQSANQVVQKIMERTSVAHKDGAPPSNIWVMLNIFRRLKEVRRQIEIKRRSATADAGGEKGLPSADTEDSELRPHTAPLVNWEEQKEASCDDEEISIDDMAPVYTVAKAGRPKTAVPSSSLRSKMIVDPEGKPYFDAETSEPVVAELESKLDNFFVKYPTVQRGYQGSRNFVKMSRYELRPEKIPLPGGTVLVRARPCPLEKISVTHSHTRHYVLPRNALKTLQDFRAMQLERASDLPAPVTPRHQPIRPKTASERLVTSHFHGKTRK